MKVIPVTFCELKLLSIIIAQAKEYDLIWDDIAWRINNEFNVALMGSELEEEFTLLDEPRSLNRENETYLLRYAEYLLIHNVADKRKFVIDLIERIKQETGEQFTIRQIEQGTLDRERKTLTIS